MADTTVEPARRSSRAKRDTSKMREAVETGEVRRSRSNSKTNPIPATAPKAYERKAGPPNAPELIRAPTPSKFNGTPPPSSGPSDQPSTSPELKPRLSNHIRKRASKSTGTRRARKPPGPKLCDTCSYPIHHPQPAYSLTATTRRWTPINISGMPNRSGNMWPADHLPRAKIIYSDAVLRAELCCKEDCECMREHRQSSVNEWAEKIEILSEEVEGVKDVEERVAGIWAKAQAMGIEELERAMGELNNDRGMAEQDAEYKDKLVMEHLRSSVAIAERLAQQIGFREAGNDTMGLLPATEQMAKVQGQLYGEYDVLSDRQKTVVPKRPAMDEGDWMGDLEAIGIPMPAEKRRKIWRC